MSKEPGDEEGSVRQEALPEPFLSTMWELVRAYQAFANYSAQHVRQLGLTPPQFDVIITLGQSPGMTMNRLGERTLVTKGTLTGIIDRLEEKCLVRREVPKDNRRSFVIVLTAEGESMFEKVFPTHTAHLKAKFSQLTEQELATIHSALQKVRELF